MSTPKMPKEAGGMSGEDGARCKTCGVLLSLHLGLYGTCAEHLDARREVDRLTAELARVDGELETYRVALAMERGI